MSTDDSLLGAQGDTASAGGSGEAGAEQTVGVKPEGQIGTEQKTASQTDDSLLGEKPEGEKAEDGKAGEEGKKEGDDKAVELTPEAYGDFTTPEGMPVNPEILGEFKTVAAELKLPKEAAQKLVDLQVKNAQAQLQQWKDVRDGWVGELKADKEYGGEKFDNTLHHANMALRQFDKDGEFLKALKGTFDNHPATVKFLARVNQALGEDAVHTARDAGKGKDVPLHERLYKDADMGFGVKP